ncbi:MAG TPA: hypothetical protein VFC90_08475 [Planctomycetota bacterium]|nr:hypothetical protein [Planctomycetota bacterium]
MARRPWRLAGLLSLLLLFPAAQSAKDKEAMGDAKKLKILLACKRGSDREARFGQFLARYFGKVVPISLELLTEKTAEGYDVVVADWERRYAHGDFQDHKKPKLRIPDGFSKPVIMVGMVGGEVQRHTKIGSGLGWWAATELQNAAHSVKKEHPIFKGPLELKLELVPVDTPEDLKKHVDGKGLPAQLETWAVQTGRVPKDIDWGFVAAPWGFEDSPDAEILASGAGCRNPRAVAMARHGNFFLWGFDGDPAQMTEAGRRVFVNTVVWMKKFDGKRPLVAPQMSPRELVFHYIEWLRDADDEDSLVAAKRRFPDDVREKTKTDPDKLEAYYKEHYERLCPAGGESGGFRADPDLDELGKVGNRKLEFWDAVLARLAKNEKDELALRVAGRYLPGKTLAPAELKAWVDENRKWLFFTDVGGFKWAVDEHAKKEEKK